MTLESDFFDLVERLKNLSDFSCGPVQRLLGVDLVGRKPIYGGAFSEFEKPQAIKNYFCDHVELFQADWGAPWRGMVILHLKKELNITDESVFLHLGNATRRDPAGVAAPGLERMMYLEYRSDDSPILRFSRKPKDSAIAAVVIENL